MKNKFILVIALLCLAFTAKAQDAITKTDGSVIYGRVIEVSSSTISYVKESNPNGPTYTLRVKDVARIDYDNGEYDIFGEQPRQVQLRPNMKYSDLRDIYNFRDYDPSAYKTYRPGLCGLASFVIPGLGQAACDEWGRAIGFFVGNITLNALAANNINKANYYDDQTYLSKAMLYYGLSFGLNIYSIIDASRIAKVKNLYYNDLRMSAVKVSVEPAFACLPTDLGQYQPSMGMALKVRF